MNIVYSVLIKGTEAFKKIRYLNEYFPLELNIANSAFLKENGVGDITDPLEGLNNIVGFKIAPILDDNTILEYLEKNIIISDELRCKRIIYSVNDEGSYLFIKKYMDDIFSLFSSYNAILVFESKNNKLLKYIYRDITEYLGGVFKISLNINNLNTNMVKIIKNIQNYFRLIDFIKVCNYNRDEIPVRILDKSSVLNIPVFLNYLLGIGYEKYLVINYEEEGVFLPLKEIIDDMTKIDELSKSLQEKIML